MVLGVLPGAFLVFLAEFVITGEWQLTVGAPGFALAGIGAIAGFAVGFLWRRGQR
jgi:hypothetical protein